jgi:tRNA(Ile)-lysidine synthase
MLPADSLGVVAVSGGADSTALLLALHQLGCRLHVAHLDHGLRPESSADAEFVRELSERLGLPCTIERRDVAPYRGARKLSPEAAAREVRYAFLRETAEREGAGAIFVAHTADDQVETFLLRLIRGAGVAGLGGMKPKDGQLCRPLLDVWRQDLEAFLREQGQEWREDASNRDPAFLRNRVRHELLPLLASLNRGVKAVLLREAGALAGRQREIEAEAFRRLGLNARQIQSALAGKAVTIGGGIRVEPPHAPRPSAKIDQPLHIPGMVTLPGIGTIRAKAVLTNGWPRPEAGVEYVDLELLDGDLRLRSWRPGDRFVPLGMDQPKKLQDFFVDERVPREQRAGVPLLVSGDAIVWVVGMRIDGRFKVTPSTTRALRLQFVPE